MSTPASACVVLLMLSAPTLRMAEPDLRTFGDPSLKIQVDARTRAIYEGVSKPEIPRPIIMTRRNLLTVPHALGTEIVGDAVEGAMPRIIATVWTKQGKYIVEYYRLQDELLFAAELFVYFDESAPKGAWHNFRGQPGWERRSYFNAQHIVGYSEARGEHSPSPGTGGPRLREQAQRLASLVQQRAPRAAANVMPASLAERS
jgi:hypothetical protein